ncbi:hypothetical protein M5689_006567 [Euphorbia peplus]|nr:hypothetical protein M5689_006567 [Euphorbia peplus]
MTPLDVAAITGLGFSCVMPPFTSPILGSEEIQNLTSRPLRPSLFRCVSTTRVYASYNGPRSRLRSWRGTSTLATSCGSLYVPPYFPRPTTVVIS